MPYGSGTYGTKVGRPSTKGKKKKPAMHRMPNGKMMAGATHATRPGAKKKKKK